MPPMPWPVFRNASDEDLKSVFAYLRTIPAITNHVPAYQEPQLRERPIRQDGRERPEGPTPSLPPFQPFPPANL